jgi:hypothetical protein
MSNTINITGSTIGAMAVGSGATASGSVGPKPAGKLRLTFEARHASREQIAKWLRALALVMDDPEHPTTSAGTTVDGAERAWSLEPDE